MYYTGDGDAGATFVAQYAELCRFELGILYDYKPTNRYAVVYAEDVNTFLRMRIETQPVPEEVGRIVLPVMHAYVIHPGTMAGLQHEIRKQVASLILKEFSYAGEMGAVIQNKWLFYTPEWFSQGMTDYISSGWTYEDDVQLAALPSQDLLELSFEGSSEANRIARKSIWFFIASEYGENKIAEMVYLSTISNSVESGVLAVLGLRIDLFTQRWREWVGQYTDAFRAGRAALADMDDLEEVRIPKGAQLLSFAYDEAHKRLAFYVSEGEQHRIYLYDPEDHRLRETRLRFPVLPLPNSYTDTRRYPMAWSNGTSILATTAFNELTQHYELLYLDVEKDNLTTHILPDGVTRFEDLAWSADNKQLVGSALHNGQTDLFVLPAFTNKMKWITNDRWDDRYPIWTADGEQIFFSSNRQDSPEAALTDDYDIFAYHLDDKSIEHLTTTPRVSESHLAMSSAFEIGYVDDASGVRNIATYHLFEQKITPRSNIATGLVEAQIGAQTLFFTVPQANGSEKLYWTALAKLAPKGVPTLTKHRQMADSRTKVSQEIERLRQQVTAQQPAATPTKPAQTPATAPKTDSTAKPPVRYYVFDEDEQAYQVKPTTPANTNAPSTTTSSVPTYNNAPQLTVFGNQPKPVWQKIKPSAPKSAPLVWEPLHVGFLMGFHPAVIKTWNLRMDASMSDFLQRRRVEGWITPYLAIRRPGFESHLRYTKRHPRLSNFFEAEVSSLAYYRQNREASDTRKVFEDDVYRFNQGNVKFGIQYPFNSKLSAEYQLGAYYLGRTNMNLLNVEQSSASDGIIRLQAGLMYNSVQQYDGFRYAGTEANFRIGNYTSIGSKQMLFTAMRLQLRHYYSLPNRVTFAFQFNGGYTIGDRQPAYYLGGTEGWLMGLNTIHTDSSTKDYNRSALSAGNLNTDLTAFHFQEFVSPIRGFRFNARNNNYLGVGNPASKFLVFNVECRMPLTRMFTNTLHAERLYNFMFIPFFDMGTVWRKGNPFSQRNPTDTQFITAYPVSIELQTLKNPFIFGAGAGLRFNIFSYSVRFDCAVGIDDSSVQKPQFNLSLGKDF